MSLMADLKLYGLANVGSAAGVVADSLLESVPGAVAGGTIATVLPNIGESRDARRAA